MSEMSWVGECVVAQVMGERVHRDNDEMTCV